METIVIESPCILVCSIDEKSGYCFGCGRTADEIAGWIAYTPESRRDIISELPERMAGLDRQPRRETKRSRLTRMRNERT